MNFGEALQNAQKSYSSGDSEAAVKQYTEALNAAPEKLRANTQLSRARALFRLGKYPRALRDCSEVLAGKSEELAFSANQLIGECYLKLEEFDDALESFKEAEKLARPGKQQEAVAAYLQETQAAVDGAKGVNYDKLKQHSNAATAADRNYVPTTRVSTLHGVQARGGDDDDDDDDDENVAAAVNRAKAATAEPVNPDAHVGRVRDAMSRPGPAMSADELNASDAPFATNIPLAAPTKYRMQYNQNSGGVEVQVFAKKLNKQPERVCVEILATHLKVEIKDEACEAVEYELDEELFAEVDVDSSKWGIWATQINIKLKKVDPSVAWPSLSSSAVPAVAGGSSIVDPTAGPAREYPSSSKKQHRDWDQLESEVKKEEKDEVLDGDAGLQKFFRQLYSGADEDTRRAMNKSFQESGGTTLSTNWKEVGTSKLECKPPDGVHVKKFEY